MIFEAITCISAANWLISKILDKGFDALYNKVTSEDFDKRFYEKINNASITLQENHPEALGGNIQYFFKHNDIFNELIKLLFVDSKVDLKVIEDKFDIATLPDDFILEFISLIKIELYKDQFFNELLANKEVFLICIGIDKKAEDILEVSSLSLSEVQSLKKLIESKFKSNFSLSSFLEQYHSSLENNYSQLSFIGLGLDLSIKKGKRKKLEDLFVEPNFSVDKSDRKKLKKSEVSLGDTKSVLLEDIFEFDSNLIILGNPGSGKSILTKYLSLKLIHKDKSIFSDKNLCDRIPFRIELRKYYAFKKENHGGLLKYLSVLMEIEYSISNVLLEDIEKIIEDNQTLILFDGLDEIFDVNDKIIIKNDIENFVTRYSNARTIVTSRIIGYDDAALIEKNAVRLTINNFSESQIEEYIKNWYLVEEEDQNVREKEIEDFLAKKEMIDEELISNPLLLSLIVILYRNNLKVPESKLEIYQSCTKTLVDKWDLSKAIEINIPEDIYKRKDTVFADLAYWQYKELSKKNGKVTYQRAKNTVGRSLTEKLKIADDFTSDYFSEQFMLYAQKRSLYFDNNFTHKTFLEYFTAFWIFSNIEKKHKKEDRDDLIKEYITNPYWHIVLELLINLIDKDQADNEIIDDLVDFQLKANEDSSTFFLQIFSSIQNVSNLTFKNIVKTSILRLIHNEEDKNSRYRENSSFFLLSRHYRNNSFKELINSCFKEISEGKINVENKERLLILYLELVNQVTRLIKLNLNIDDDDILNYFPEIEEFENPLIFVLIEFIYNRPDLESDPLSFAAQYLRRYGKNTFVQHLSANFANFRYFPMQNVCLNHVLFHPDKKLLNEYINLIEMYDISIGELIRNIFEIPFYYENSDKNLKKLIDKFNNLVKTDYLILLVPIFYKLRFDDIFGLRKNISPNLKSLINSFKDKNFGNNLNFIVDKENNESSVKKYIEEKFEIDSSFIKPF